MLRDAAFPNHPQWLTRPARRQVDDATLQQHLADAEKRAGERNLWSGRRVGGGRGGAPGGGSSSSSSSRGQRQAKEASKFRCRPELDVGRTRGSDAQQRTFCLYFAKGCCNQGSACTFLHRLPTADDEAYHVRDMSADLFGREKRAEHEGYRKGAGTFERDNRTLYVNYEGAGTYDLPKLRELLETNFRLWGPANNIYIVYNKTIAFVRYDWRTSAEFAKEAMHKQPLIGSTMGEVLTVRWANEDPNPVAVVAAKRSALDSFAGAAMSSWEALPPEQKKARIMALQLQVALKKGQAVAPYPETDGQYGDASRQDAVREVHPPDPGQAAPGADGTDAADGTARGAGADSAEGSDGEEEAAAAGISAAQPYANYWEYYKQHYPEHYEAWCATQQQQQQAQPAEDAVAAWASATGAAAWRYGYGQYEEQEGGGALGTEGGAAGQEENALSSLLGGYGSGSEGEDADEGDGGGQPDGQE